MAEEQWSDGEASLVAGLKDRDAAAWTALYDEHHPAVFRYIQVRTGNSPAAEDLAAQVFLEAIKGIRTYRYRGTPVLAWLYRIARNVVSDHFKALRRGQAQPLNEILEPVASGVGGSRPSAATASWSEDPAAEAHLLDVRNAMLKLKDTHREVLVLHYYVGLPLPEVALMLGKRERAVYSLHARAIEALRRLV